MDAGDKLSVSNSDAKHSVKPLSAVGKGTASYRTHQVVNQNYFGRCLDVTNREHLVLVHDRVSVQAGPERQTQVRLEPQVVLLRAELEGQEYVSTQIKVNNGSDYCLITNDTPGVTGSPGDGSHKDNGKTGSFKVTYSYPKFVTSANKADCAQAPRRRGGAMGITMTPRSRTHSLTATKCASPQPDPVSIPKTPATPSCGRSIAVVPCDGSDNQKWNVPDTPVTASIGDYEEVTGRTGG